MLYLTRKTKLSSLFNRVLFSFAFGTIMLFSGCNDDNDGTSPVAPVPVNNVLTLRSISLTGAKEVPATASTATGTFTGTYDVNSNVLSYTVNYTGITPTAMHFHRGAPGQAGPIDVNLTVPTSSPNTGSVTLTSTQEMDLLGGEYYINIHSATYPGGEIRGQVLTPDLQIFENIDLAGAFEVPATASPDTGEFNAIFNTSTNILTYNVSTNVAVPTAFHIHTGAAGISGPITITLTTPSPSPITGETGAFTSQQETDLLAGNLYVNIHNATYPNGAIRGQLANENIIVFSNTILTGAKEVPANASTATATYYATYNLTTNVLSYTVYYTGITPTAFHIHPGAVGVNGPIEIPLTTPTISPTSGTTPALTATQETDLLNGLKYVNLHSAAYPNGEIRGQLNP